MAPEADGSGSKGWDLLVHCLSTHFKAKMTTLSMKWDLKSDDFGDTCLVRMNLCPYCLMRKF